MNKIITATEAKQMGYSVARQRVYDYVDAKLLSQREKDNFYDMFDDIKNECTRTCSPTFTVIEFFTKRFFNCNDIIKILEGLEYKTELNGDNLIVRW